MPFIKEMQFEVVHRGESAAGIRPYTETVSIKFEGGIDAGAVEEFRSFLLEYYDGAKVYTAAEHKAMADQEAKQYAQMEAYEKEHGPSVQEE